MFYKFLLKCFVNKNLQVIHLVYFVEYFQRNLGFHTNFIALQTQ